MRVEVISDKNPYLLDVTKEEPQLIALTRKNANFTKAVIESDSMLLLKGVGSTKNEVGYWFKRMIDDPQKYKDYLEESIKAVNKTHKTHLLAIDNGVSKMFDIIIRHCPSVDSLRRAVDVDPSLDQKDNLFYLLCKTTINNKGEKTNNISFASKYIACARKYLNNKPTFSKYDRVVSRKLPLYEKVYVDNDLKPFVSKYLNSSFERGKMKEDFDARQDYTYSVYIRYMSAIKRVLSSLKKDNSIEMNEEEFDHIVWYSYK